MIEYIGSIGRCLCLTLIFSLLSSVDLCADSRVAELSVISRSLDSDTTTHAKSKKKSKKKRVKKRDRKKDLPDSVDVNRQYVVVGGILTEVGTKAEVAEEVAEEVADTLSNIGGVVALDSLDRIAIGDSSALHSDSTGRLLTKREGRVRDRKIDTVRHNRFFRDSIPLSRMCAISMAVPGFSQLYNDQTWKIPILYGTAGTAVYFGLKQNKLYSGYKSTYDALLRSNASRDEITPVQTKMIQHNTYRQLLFAGALVSYVYFIGDGAVNYGGTNSSVKKATTLSTICPGAGQFYNKSYWKVPIVLGGFATMAYVIDFNNRGYQRFKLAADLVADGNDATVDEFGGRYLVQDLNNYKKSYRRNRDLSIIITAAFYLLNIVDAHVDAHLQDYDISDDLTVDLDLVPMFSNVYSMSKGNQNLMGMSLMITF